ncbi:aminoglycoside N-acetyltransferase AAC(2')-Ic [Nocardioides caricicola]
MVTVRRCHTGELTDAELAEVRGLMEVAFEGDFDAHDWAHALGGMHVTVRNQRGLVAHGAVVQRRLLVAGRALSCGYVEAVAVHPEHRRAGLGSAVMASLEELAPAYDLLALSASDEGVALYEARGWLRWRGPTSAISPDGLVRTEDDDDSVYVLPGAVVLDLDAPVACDWRDGDVW